MKVLSDNTASRLLRHLDAAEGGITPRRIPRGASTTPPAPMWQIHVTPAGEVTVDGGDVYVGGQRHTLVPAELGLATGDSLVVWLDDGSGGYLSLETSSWSPDPDTAFRVIGEVRQDDSSSPFHSKQYVSGPIEADAGSSRRRLPWHVEAAEIETEFDSLQALRVYSGLATLAGEELPAGDPAPYGTDPESALPYYDIPIGVWPAGVTDAYLVVYEGDGSWYFGVADTPAGAVFAGTAVGHTPSHPGPFRAIAKVTVGLDWPPEVMQLEAGVLDLDHPSHVWHCEDYLAPATEGSTSSSSTPTHVLVRLGAVFDLTHATQLEYHEVSAPPNWSGQQMPSLTAVAGVTFPSADLALVPRTNTSGYLSVGFAAKDAVQYWRFYWTSAPEMLTTHGVAWRAVAKMGPAGVASCLERDGALVLGGVPPQTWDVRRSLADGIPKVFVGSSPVCINGVVADEHDVTIGGDGWATPLQFSDPASKLYLHIGFPSASTGTPETGVVGKNWKWALSISPTNPFASYGGLSWSHVVSNNGISELTGALRITAAFGDGDIDCGVWKDGACSPSACIETTGATLALSGWRTQGAGEIDDDDIDEDCGDGLSLVIRNSRNGGATVAYLPWPSLKDWLDAYYGGGCSCEWPVDEGTWVYVVGADDGQGGSYSGWLLIDNAPEVHDIKDDVGNLELALTSVWDSINALEDRVSALENRVSALEGNQQGGNS